MKISWNWLSEMVDLSQVGGPQGLAELLTARGLEVEAIERQDQGLEKVVTAQIVHREQHPQSDRLSLCQVSTGSGDPLQIVCGAPNARAGIHVALAQIGAELPNGVKIGVGKIRGVESFGMLCSESELKLADTSEGILELPADTQSGIPLARFLGRDDAILVFKLTANRGDCMSHFGMAREVAAALGQKPKRTQAKVLNFSNSPISISLEAGENAPQFFGCLIEGVRIGPSPTWVVKRLEALGSRSINNVVDATNLVMLELGHPVHAYDADLIRGGRIGVRMSKDGESLLLLDGGTVQLSGSELVIFDGEGPMGLAGVMGGGNSEVRPTTQRVFLECAEFHPGLVRKAASKYQRRTDAAQRFEKGIDPLGLSSVISRLSSLILDVAGGRVVGAGSAVFQAGAAVQSSSAKEIVFSEDYFTRFLGLKSGALSPQRAEEILTSLDCVVRKNGNQHWTVIPPSYRRDLRIPEDLAEEVARTLGYDQIPATIPPLSSDPTFASSMRGRLALMGRAKDTLVGLGFQESLNFAFTSKSWLAKFGFTGTGVELPLMNPLSEEYEAMVPSLLPGLVRNALDNWHRHFGSDPLAIRLFELRPIFTLAQAGQPLQARGEMETGAAERWKLSIVLSGSRFANGLRNEMGEVDFYDLKAVVESTLEGLGARGVRFQPMSASRTGGNALFHPGQSVEILAGKEVAGYFGLLHPAQAKELKTRAPLWMAEMDWESIAKLSRGASQPRVYKPVSQFPSIERDFALVVKSDVTADRITQVAVKAGKPLAKVVKIFDIYRGSQVGEGMTSVAVRVIFNEDNRSLQESEAEAASQSILQAWKKELDAQLRD
ncbi:phenylalanine--tRNA ligase subunit beta [Bdellovibrionota bacterium FG-1]